MRRAIWAVAMATVASAQEPFPPEPAHIDRRPFPKLTIKVEVEERKLRGPQGEIVRDLWFSGEADYPDNTVIAVDATLDGSDSALQDRPSAPVKDKKWSTRERATVLTVGRNANKGLYVIRAGFSGDLQPHGWERRLNPLANAGIQYAIARVEIGSAEEVQAEHTAALQFYVRLWKASRVLADELEAEYYKQRKEFVKSDWYLFKDNMLDSVEKKDRELLVFRHLRENVAIPKICAKLGGFFASTPFVLDDLELGLPIAGETPPEARLARAATLLKDMKGTLDSLEPELGAVKEDPEWRLPKKEAPPKPVHPKPPPDALPDKQKPQGAVVPKPDPTPATPRFTALEGGIVFAVLCGAGLLFAVLRRK